MRKDDNHKLDTIHTYSHRHNELEKEAKKQLKGRAKEIYKMKVFTKNILGIKKEFCELRANTVAKLKHSKQSFADTYQDVIFEYGEIKPIKVK